MLIVEAETGDASAVTEVIRLCVAQMRAAGIQQWDEIYPDYAVIADDIRARTLYVAREERRAVAAICLNEVQPDEYRDVAWRCRRGRVLVVHRLCVHPDWQAHGLARQLMDFAEQLARDRGYACVRLDAYTGNPRAMAIYERRGYVAVGRTRFPRRPLPFVCFELVMGEPE